MKGRHEVKHYINMADYYVLRSRLNAVLMPDSHAGADGTYQIRSLYFDTADNKALLEKLNGVRKRAKYRIRYYNYNDSFIQLEKKIKDGNACIKVSETITREEAEKIISGDIEWMRECDRPLLNELYVKMHNDGLKPSTIVEYTRDPFTFPAGNVRVTLDHHIRTGIKNIDFFDPECVTVPIPDDVILLEVKWDNYLPDIVRDTVQMNSRRGSAFSKYAACRAYDF